jgi:hypothetical protein
MELTIRPKDCSICRRIAEVFFYRLESTWLCRQCLDFVLVQLRDTRGNFSTAIRLPTKDYSPIEKRQKVSIHEGK